MRLSEGPLLQTQIHLDCITSIGYGMVGLLLHYSGKLDGCTGMWINTMISLWVSSRLQWFTGGIMSPVQLGPSLFAFRVCGVSVSMRCV